MRKLLLALLIAAWASTPVVAQGTHDARFPFMAWDYVDKPQILQSMRDAGITSVAFVPAKMLETCGRLNLHCILFDSRLSGSDWTKPFDGDQFRKNLPVVLKEIGNPKGLYGIHIKDEPPERDFAELAKAVAAVKELAPGKWPYINLFPGKGAKYDQYLENFAQVSHPTALSYDRYSLYEPNGSGTLDNLFWENLAQVRSAALKHKLPFWNIVLSSPHWAYRELSPADLRIQVWSSLAYGVNGISYYKFISKELPILGADDLGNWRGGPLDQFEQKTPTWDWLRDLNREIQNIAPVFQSLRTDDVYHIGGEIPAENHGPSETSLVKSMPKGEVVVGDFTAKDGTRYALIVNKSLTHSIHCNPEYTSKPISVSYVSARTGKVTPYNPKYFWLAPGQGVLLQLGK
ncbi:MAG TPA: hypothetical protein VN577_01945 [Terriglobales bacterium]|nr:hypothetical protein [Terriglobales bacterium]